MVNMEKITTPRQIEQLAQIATSIWHEYFPCILSDEQIDYMVEQFQSQSAITAQMEKEGYEYFFIKQGDEVLGYAGVCPKDGKLLLSKFYLKKEHRGHGYARQAMDFLVALCKNRGLCCIWLTVNRMNAHSIQVYQAMGFTIAKSQVADIGNGFVMDDYIMEKSIQ